MTTSAVNALIKEAFPEAKFATGDRSEASEIARMLRAALSIRYTVTVVRMVLVSTVTWEADE